MPLQRRRPRCGRFDMPIEIPRILDFIPVLSLQTELNKDAIYYHYVANVSTPITKLVGISKIKSGEETTELGGKVKRNPMHRLQSVFEYGFANPDTSNDVEFVRQEVLEEILGYDVPDAVGQERGLKLAVPKSFEDFDVLQGSDKLLLRDVAIGNYIHKNRSMLNAPWLENPMHIAREYLLSQKIVKSPRDKRLSLRIRSSFKNSWIITDKMRGWNPLLPIMLPLEKAIIDEINPWQHIGIPVKYHLFPDGKDVTLFDVNKHGHIAL